MNLDELFNASKQLDYDHSNGMVKVGEMKGPGFFPGCTGTIDSIKDISGLRCIVLGQDFDTEANHKEINPVKGEIETNSTWRNLRTLLPGRVSTPCSAAQQDTDEPIKDKMY